MIDPVKITNFKRTDAELEEFWLFTLVTGGHRNKNSKEHADQVNKFLKGNPHLANQSPYGMVRHNFSTDSFRSSFGGDYTDNQYDKLLRTVRESVQKRDLLKSGTVEELSNIHGVTPRMAHFFVLHTRPNQRLVVLDSHMLEYLRKNGHKDVPKGIPTSEKNYHKVEKMFLEHIDKVEMTPVDFDLLLWNRYLHPELTQEEVEKMVNVKKVDSSFVEEVYEYGEDKKEIHEEASEEAKEEAIIHEHMESEKEEEVPQQTQPKLTDLQIENLVRQFVIKGVLYDEDITPGDFEPVIHGEEILLPEHVADVLDRAGIHNASDLFYYVENDVDNDMDETIAEPLEWEVKDIKHAVSGLRKELLEYVQSEDYLKARSLGPIEYRVPNPDIVSEDDSNEADVFEPVPAYGDMSPKA